MTSAKSGGGKTKISCNEPNAMFLTVRLPYSKSAVSFIAQEDLRYIILYYTVFVLPPPLLIDFPLTPCERTPYSLTECMLVTIRYWFKPWLIYLFRIMICHRLCTVINSISGSQQRKREQVDLTTVII